MMALTGLTLAFAVLAAVGTGWLGLLFLRDPARGFAATAHRPEQLPKVMGGRYFALSLLAIGSAVYGDLKVIAYLFAVFAVVSLADVWIYLRIDRPYSKHLQAGVLSIVVTVVALLALNSGVTA